VALHVTHREVGPEGAADADDRAELRPVQHARHRAGLADAQLDEVSATDALEVAALLRCLLRRPLSLAPRASKRSRKRQRAVSQYRWISRSRR